MLKARHTSTTAARWFCCRGNCDIIITLSLQMLHRTNERRWRFSLHNSFIRQTRGELHYCYLVLVPSQQPQRAPYPCYNIHIYSHRWLWLTEAGLVQFSFVPPHSRRLNYSTFVCMLNFVCGNRGGMLCSDGCEEKNMQSNQILSKLNFNKSRRIRRQIRTKTFLNTFLLQVLFYFWSYFCGRLAVGLGCAFHPKETAAKIKPFLVYCC